MLDSAVVIVIIAICDMPRQEFSLCERVYIHNMYMETESRVLKHDANFVPAQLEDRLKDSKKQAP